MRVTTHSENYDGYARLSNKRSFFKCLPTTFRGSYAFSFLVFPFLIRLAFLLFELGDWTDYPQRNRVEAIVSFAK